MSLERGIRGTEPGAGEPVARVAGPAEHRRVAPAGLVARGTLACPSCDAPVSPGELPLSPAERIACPFCAVEGPVRDFLSLASTRPAHVEVRIVRRSR